MPYMRQGETEEERTNRMRRNQAFGFARGAKRRLRRYWPRRHEQSRYRPTMWQLVESEIATLRELQADGFYTPGKPTGSAR